MAPAGPLGGANRRPDPLQGGPSGATEPHVPVGGVGPVGLTSSSASEGKAGAAARRKPKRSQAPARGEAPRSTMRMGGVPVERLLTTVRGPISIEVESQPGAEIQEAKYRVDGGPSEPLARIGRVWRGEVEADRLSDGPHHVEVEVRDPEGGVEISKGTFTVRRRPV